MLKRQYTQTFHFGLKNSKKFMFFDGIRFRSKKRLCSKVIAAFLHYGMKVHIVGFLLAALFYGFALSVVKKWDFAAKHHFIGQIYVMDLISSGNLKNQTLSLKMKHVLRIWKLPRQIW